MRHEGFSQISHLGIERGALIDVIVNDCALSRLLDGDGCSLDPLNPENGLEDLLIFDFFIACRSESFRRVINHFLRVGNRTVSVFGALRESVHVKEPLVDLHARKPSLSHGFALDLGIPVSIEFLVEVVKILKLLSSLLLAMDRAIDHCRSQAFVDFLLAEALSGDLWGQCADISLSSCRCDWLKQLNVDIINAVVHIVDLLSVRLAAAVVDLVDEGVGVTPVNLDALMVVIQHLALDFLVLLTA